MSDPTTPKSELSPSPDPFTPAEEQELARLLRKIPKNNWFLPEPAFEPFHQAIPTWAPELVILESFILQSSEETRILLAMYEPSETGAGKFFGGSWHIPGGYNRWNESIQQTCSRLARRELNTDVVVNKVLDAYKWGEGEHPYGRPLSLFVQCKPIRIIEETDRRRFFPVGELPFPIVDSHLHFIQEHFCS